LLLQTTVWPAPAPSAVPVTVIVPGEALTPVTLSEIQTAIGLSLPCRPAVA
jgi:hypothetical protein